MSHHRLLPFALMAALLAACGASDKNQEPEAARDLWGRIQGESYRDWARAPGYETRKPSQTAHGSAVSIYINGTTSQALSSTGQTTWPTGTLIVKDVFQGETHTDVAAMEKRADGWFFAEWDTAGAVKYSGRPSVCVDCHASGKDSVRAFSLPE